MNNLNYEDWVKATYQHCEDPTEHNEEENNEGISIDDVDVDLCLQFIEDHNMMETFYDWADINPNK
jgi:hypothetical protein